MAQVTAADGPSTMLSKRFALLVLTRWWVVWPLSRRRGYWS
jgi:hypothetical protein